MESRNCLETVPGGVPGLWELITLDCKLWSRRGLNQSCSPRWDLSNGLSHSQFGLREEVDSRLLVVGSQTASFTLGPSFAHNLGDRCPNAQCEGIFDIYASRPFQRHQEHPNARCFGSCYRALNIRESRRTPNPQLFQGLGFTPTLGQVRVETSFYSLSFFYFCQKFWKEWKKREDYFIFSRICLLFYIAHLSFICFYYQVIPSLKKYFIKYLKFEANCKYKIIRLDGFISESFKQHNFHKFKACFDFDIHFFRYSIENISKIGFEISQNNKIWSLTF